MKGKVCRISEILRTEYSEVRLMILVSYTGQKRQEGRWLCKYPSKRYYQSGSLRGPYQRLPAGGDVFGDIDIHNHTGLAYEQAQLGTSGC